jgi:hypothetical protein
MSSLLIARAITKLQTDILIFWSPFWTYFYLTIYKKNLVTVNDNFLEDVQYIEF